VCDSFCDDPSVSVDVPLMAAAGSVFFRCCVRDDELLNSRVSGAQLVP
jgi:hypothetical protein